MALHEVGFIEVFPPRAAGSRPPVLLQTLEAQLLEATNAAARSASAGPHQQRDPNIAANLSLDAHRQVFQTFIDGFGVYGPLLSQVKQGFDQAIEAGLKDALDNSNLRLQLLTARQEQASATSAAKAEIIDGEAPQRERLYHDIAAAQARLTAAQQRRSLALKDLNRAKQELERLRGLAKGSKATKQRLADAAAAEADWLARPGAAGTLSMIAGPLSKQEDEELEAELGLALESSTPKHPLEQALQLLEKHDAAAAAKLLEQHTGASSSGGTGKQQQQQQQQQPAEPSPEVAEEQQQQHAEEQAEEQAECDAEGEQPASCQEEPLLPQQHQLQEGS
ncbi:hypothetical protein OEZ85_011588 [Tetradesmus obliquus]|uniref:Translin-associated factor X-interacting protein 1 N-terminal domain-containing protein n=1 Tax=Tetradesmus obliquus TaxID=3088 RepID=A0ABY8TQU0_TETOB|nr:hypothetical protein OEZ85_011588 [Tetradesmus obliquus]